MPQAWRSFMVRQAHHERRTLGERKTLGGEAHHERKTLCWKSAPRTGAFGEGVVLPGGDELFGGHGWWGFLKFRNTHRRAAETQSFRGENLWQRRFFSAFPLRLRDSVVDLEFSSQTLSFSGLLVSTRGQDKRADMRQDPPHRSP